MLNNLLSFSFLGRVALKIKKKKHNSLEKGDKSSNEMLILIET